MGLRDKMLDRTRMHLEPGEHAQHAFVCQTGPSPYYLFLTWLVFFRIKYRIVVVTDRAIVVFPSKRTSATPTGPPIVRLPRATRLGPVSGLWTRKALANESVWIHRRFKKDVDAADAEIGRRQVAHAAP